MFPKQIKCEPIWDGKEYINCKNLNHNSINCLNLLKITNN